MQKLISLLTVLLFIFSIGLVQANSNNTETPLVSYHKLEIEPSKGLISGGIRLLTYSYVRLRYGAQAANSWKQIQKVKKAIERGERLSGYAKPKRYYNRSKPKLPEGRYKEYDVYPLKTGSNRGTERIVVDESSGKIYYTPDHYKSWRQIK